MEVSESREQVVCSSYCFGPPIPRIYNEDEKENIKMTLAEEATGEFIRIVFETFKESTADEKQKRIEAMETYDSISSIFAQRVHSVFIEENNLTDMPEEVIHVLNQVELVAMVTIFRHLVLLAILFGYAAKLKELTSPGRNRICCVNVFLLSNEGAHAYNGNGNLFTKHRREERVRLIKQDELEHVINRIVIQSGTINCCNRSLHDEQKAKRVDASTQCDVNESIDNFQLSTGIPSEKEISRMAHGIGKEYRALATELGFTFEELDHIRDEFKCPVDRNSAILNRWKKRKADEATFKELANAMAHAKINPTVVFGKI